MNIVVDQPLKQCPDFQVIKLKRMTRAKIEPACFRDLIYRSRKTHIVIMKFPTFMIDYRGKFNFFARDD